MSFFDRIFFDRSKSLRSLSLAQCLVFDEDDYPLFRSWIKELESMPFRRVPVLRAEYSAASRLARFFLR